MTQISMSTPPSALVNRFERLAAERGETLAVWSRHEKKRLSFAALAQRSHELGRALEGFLAELSCALPSPSASDGTCFAGRCPVGLAVGNRIDFMAAFLALRRDAWPVVLMDSAADPATTHSLCRQLGLAAYVAPQSSRPASSEPTVAEGGEASPSSADSSFLVQSLAGTDLVWVRQRHAEPISWPGGVEVVKLTSGSTGAVRAVCFDERALLVGVQQIAGGMGIRAGDRVLIAIPLSHSYGFDNGPLSLFALGTPLVLESSFYPRQLVATLAATQATVLPLVPPLVRAMAAISWPQDLALRLVISAGGHLATEDAAAFLAASGRPVHNFYGSTETGGIAFERAPNDPSATGAVGHPLPGVEVAFDGDRSVRIRSAANRLGFGGETTPVSAWVRPGDLGTLRADGRLVLVGRSASMLDVGGRSLSTVSVEDALRALAGVRDAAVVGLPAPGRGHRLVAFLVADPDPVDLKPLPPSMRPRAVHRVDALPYSGRGKLDRATLATWARTAEERP